MNYGTPIQWNTTQEVEGTNYLNRQQHGRVSKTLCWVTRASHKRLHTVWFHLYFILEKTRSLGQKTGEWFPGGWEGAFCCTPNISSFSPVRHLVAKLPRPLWNMAVWLALAKEMWGEVKCVVSGKALEELCVVVISLASAVMEISIEMEPLLAWDPVTKRNIASLLTGLRHEQEKTLTLVITLVWIAWFLVQHHGTFISLKFFN